MNIEEFKLPLITIITSTYNCKEALRETAISIRNQNYKKIQWIIIDGSSTDGTVNVIEENSDIVSNWSSEPDTGIYDAWNKACRLIKGEWVLFLGAGDLLYSNTTLDIIASSLIKLGDDDVILYGAVQMRSAGVDRYINKSENLKGWEFARPKLPHHQGTLQRNTLFTSESPFDTSYRVAADSKFLLAAMKKGHFKSIDMTVSIMEDDGVSNNFKNNFLVQCEINRVCAELEINQPIIYLFKAYVHRVSFFIAHSILPSRVKLSIKAFRDKVRS